MAEWALVRKNVIENIILVADDPEPHEEFDPGAYVKEDSNPYDRAVDLSTLSARPVIGWVYKQGAGYVAPVTVTTDKLQIVGDGVDTATVTYTDNNPAPAASVPVSVNGQNSTLNLTNGVGQVAVTSKNPGDLVHVAVNHHLVEIGVQ